MVAGTRGAHDIGSFSTVQRSVRSAEPPAARSHFERSTGLLGGTVALVSGDGYFGIKGHFDIARSALGLRLRSHGTPRALRCRDVPTAVGHACGSGAPRRMVAVECMVHWRHILAAGGGLRRRAARAARGRRQRPARINPYATMRGLAASAGLLAMALVLFMAECGNKQATGGRRQATDGMQVLYHGGS
jgi:hypothetical protein